MSIKAINWAWDQQLPPNSKLILMAIADAADEEGNCWPKIKTIAKKCSVSQRTVQRALKDFISNNFISVTARYSHEGRQVSNNYRLSYLNPYPDNLSPSVIPQRLGGDDVVTPGVSRCCQGEGGSVVADLEPPHESTRESIESASLSLTLPKSLNEPQRIEILELLDGRPHAYGKMLLDNLADALDRKVIKTSPEKWFRGMLRKTDKNTSRSISGESCAQPNIETEESYRLKMVQIGMDPEIAACIASKTKKN